MLLFGALRDVMHCDSVAIAVPPEDTSTLTVASLLSACREQYPQFAPWLPHLRVAVNCEYSAPETPIQLGDEVAFIPPVAGG